MVFGNSSSRQISLVEVFIRYAKLFVRTAAEYAYQDVLMQEYNTGEPGKVCVCVCVCVLALEFATGSPTTVTDISAVILRTELEDDGDVRE